ncbi:unnamed protein product [Dibothriocephalus latus]|uniref:Multidrug and toxin extrusion protein n=1 Tax=Dibothriocephalus latus TaxID=60516 RepID=A0A3P6TYW7_DIBLA|nr:unnamed protein product [Dibothriocephalus latus]
MDMAIRYIERSFTLSAGLLATILLTALRGEIPKLFSNDPGVIEMAKDYFPSMITFQFIDAINGINMGIVRGVGKQKIGAVVCCVCMYLIGGPAGLSLMFLTNLRVSGFWWGLSIGALAQAVSYTIINVRIDWTRECERAAKRTVINFVGDTNEAKIENADSPPGYDFRGEKLYNEEKEDDEEEEEEEGREPVKGCPPKVLLTRSLFVSIMVLTVIVSVCCRLFLDWSNYFPSYCLLRNSTLLPIPKKSDRLANPQQFKWLQRDCIDILPSQ